MPIGVVLQMASVATESVRLTLVQILLQVRALCLLNDTSREACLLWTGEAGLCLAE